MRIVLSHMGLILDISALIMIASYLILVTILRKFNREKKVINLDDFLPTAIRKYKKYQEPTSNYVVSLYRIFLVSLFITVILFALQFILSFKYGPILIER